MTDRLPERSAASRTRRGLRIRLPVRLVRIAVQVGLGVGVAMLVGSGRAGAELERVGISLVSLSDPFAVSFVQGATAWARNVNPDVEVLAVSSDHDAGRQSRHVDNFVAMQVDVILLDTRDSLQLAPALAEAREAEVALVAIDGPVTDTDAAIRVDHRRAGYIACRYIAERLRGHGNIVIQPGPPRRIFRQRTAGCKAALAEFEGVEILSERPRGGGTMEGGRQVMELHLQQFPSIDAVFASTDLQAIGADMALREAGFNGIVIASVDGAPAIENALKSRTMIEASAGIDPYLMGQLAMEIGYRLVLGESLDEREIVVQPELITRSNVEDHRGWLMPR